MSNVLTDIQLPQLSPLRLPASLATIGVLYSHENLYILAVLVDKKSSLAFYLAKELYQWCEERSEKLSPALLINL